MTVLILLATTVVKDKGESLSHYAQIVFRKHWILSAITNTKLRMYIPIIVLPLCCCGGARFAAITAKGNAGIVHRVAPIQKPT